MPVDRDTPKISSADPECNAAGYPWAESDVALLNREPDLLWCVLPTLPRDYWQGAAGRERARAATRWLVAELGLTTAPVAEIARTVTAATFTTHGLAGMLQAVYSHSPYAALADVYPDLQPWQMTRTPKGYWKGPAGREHARAATRWLITQLGLAGADPQHIASLMDEQAFYHRGLRGMLQIVYAGNPYAALQDVYPDLHVRPVRQVPQDRGTGRQDGAQAAPRQGSVPVVCRPEDYTVSPRRWKRNTPRDYWQGTHGRERAREATRAMLVQLGLADAPAQEGARMVNAATYAAHGLAGMLSIVYGQSPYAALADVYPDLQPWQMACTPMGYWKGTAGREHARAATRWLIVQLGLASAEPTEIADRITKQAFYQRGLGGMLDSVYGGSPYAALLDLFPDLNPWQMRHVPLDYWDGEAGRERAQAATRQMIAQLGLAGAPPIEIAQQIDHDTFTRMHLAGMLAVVYRGSPYAALQDVYSDLQPWQMPVVPRGYWQGNSGREHARAATYWLVAQLGLQGADPQRLLESLDRATFVRHGLGGMLASVYHNRVAAALADAEFLPS